MPSLSRPEPEYYLTSGNTRDWKADLLLSIHQIDKQNDSFFAVHCHEYGLYTREALIKNGDFIARVVRRNGVRVCTILQLKNEVMAYSQRPTAKSHNASYAPR